MPPLSLPTPDVFPAFPFDPPYSIQVDLMKHLYSSIEQKQVSIVESPTGTGKTLGLLCASLSWLTDEQRRARTGRLASSPNDGQPDWVAAQALRIQQRELETQHREYEEKLSRARKAEARLKALARARPTKRHRPTQRDPDDDDDEATFLPREPDEHDNIAPAVRALMEKVHKGCGASDVKEPTCTKIYYASRTHSQLTQILPELRKLRFPFPLHGSMGPLVDVRPDTPPDQSSRRRTYDDHILHDDDEPEHRQWRTVSLGSRKQLCINDDIRSRPGDLDERCRELMEAKRGHPCQYLSPLDGSKLAELRDQILASPKDIEDLALAGRNAEICPYYGSRKAIPQAELVMLPYNLLLHKSARESLGIDLTNQIVIVDEAHNLIPTLLSLSSVGITSKLLTSSLRQVETYHRKFRARLSTQHSLSLGQLVSYLNAISKVMEDWKTVDQHHPAREKTQVMSIPDFVQRLGQKVDGINLLEIEAYLRKSKIARKISGYAEATIAVQKDRAREKPCLPLHVIEAFMLGLAGAREDGRIIISTTGNGEQSEVEIKYLLLNPETSFREIVDSARSVILAGGTMSPMSEVINRLFSFLPSERVTTFSCNHIVPRSHVQTLVLSKGPSGSLLEFKHAQQSDRQVLKELGQLVINLCNVVPRGMVVFLPSYSSLNAVRTEWRTSGFLDRISLKKKVFWEPQENDGVESILRDYADAARSSASGPTMTTTTTTDKKKKTGAVLFAVVGAKLSEGLNFSDDLARMVVVIGLPFANLHSPELRERMRYANEMKEEMKRGCGGGGGGGEQQRGRSRDDDAGSELYLNMCMNAVNQSIGRAIRHRLDWASLLLVDHRYASHHIRNKLPTWIQQGLAVCESFGQGTKQLGAFYRDKKQSMDVQDSRT